MVNVMDMFCDLLFYCVIWEKVVLELCFYLFIKIWYVGCLIGEEVYFMVILLWEEGLGDCVVIYVMDINFQVFDQVSKGVYYDWMLVMV